MCPGRPAACARIWWTRWRSSSGSAKRVIGVEITLHRDRVVEVAPGLVERDSPVESEDVGAGLAHGGEQAGGVDSEVDDGNAEGLHFADEDFRRGQDEVAIVGDAERSGPAVEDLDDVGSGGDLLRGIFAEDDDELVEQHAAMRRAGDT